MSIDLQNLEEAVLHFYQSDAKKKESTHEFLMQMQDSPMAWQFAWDLMLPQKSCEVQFFGASTLHKKLLRHFQEVPKEAHEQLKEKLLEAILAFGNGPKLVLNRLCLALGIYIINMLPDEWPTAIEDVVNLFQSKPLPNVAPMTQAWILWEILTGIPDRKNVQCVAARTQRTASILEVVEKRSQLILSTITQFIQHKCSLETCPVLTDEDMVTLMAAIKCAGEWFPNGCALDVGTQFTAIVLNLVNRCYWMSIKSNDGCLAARENELIETSLDILGRIQLREAHQYPNTALETVRLFLEALQPILTNEWKEHNLNEDVAAAIYIMIISTIEGQSKLLLHGIKTDARPEHRKLYQMIIEEMLRCTNKPGIYPVEESCSHRAMGFWYMLQDEVFSLTDANERKHCLDTIRPVYEHLTRILVRKAVRPNESDLDRWGDDDLEAFRCYRQDIADTLNFCYEVLGDPLLGHLSALLDESIVAIQMDKQRNWTQLEAVVYMFSMIAEHVPVTEKQVLPKLMTVLNEIPYDSVNDLVLGSALETIGAYCEWLKENTECLSLAISLLLRGLNSTQASQATMGLKELTRECQTELRSFSEPLLEACQQTLQGGHLKPLDSVRLMFSVGKLMSLLSTEKIPMCLDAFVSPCFQELQQLVQDGMAGGDSSGNGSVGGRSREDNKKRTVFRLNMISTLYSSLNVNLEPNKPGCPPTTTTGGSCQQPVLVIIEQTMPIFRQICEYWMNETEIMEALCNGLKYAVTNLLDDFKPMLNDLCELLCAITRAKCIPPAMDLSKTCITMFYTDESSRPILQKLFEEIVSQNLNLMEQRVTTGSLSDISDVIESFYAFCANIIKKMPTILAGSSVLDCNKLLSSALATLTMPENGPVKQSTLFLTHFIQQSRNYPPMTQATLDQGERIVSASVMCVSVVSPRQQVELFADIFLAFNKKYPAEFVMWMKVLQVPEFPTPEINQAHKKAFMDAVIKERVNKRLIQEHIRGFAGKCRKLEHWL